MNNNEFWNSMCVLVAIVSIAALITMGVFFNNKKSKEHQKKNLVCFNLANDDCMQHVSYSQKSEYKYVRRNGIYVKCFKETLSNGSITQIQTINVFPNAVEHRENVKTFCTR